MKFENYTVLWKRFTVPWTLIGVTDEWDNTLIDNYIKSPRDERILVQDDTVPQCRWVELAES